MWSSHSRRVVSLSLIALITASLVLLAVHASFMHDRALSSSKCPVCQWEKGLAVGPAFAPPLPEIGAGGPLRSEAARVFYPVRVGLPFSARSPPPPSTI